MAFNVSNLTNYTKKATELLREGVLFNDNFKEFSIQTGIKYREPLNILDTNVHFQPGGCSLGNSGDTFFNEKFITVAKYAVKKSFCVADLQEKNLPLLPGSMLDKLSPEIEVVLTADIQDKTLKQIEEDLWLGTTGLIDGWINQISGCSGTIKLTNYSGVTVTVSNVNDVVNEFISKVTDGMWSRGVLTLYCSVAIYNMYKRNRLAANLFHLSDDDLGPMESWLFGYEGQIKIKATPGLAGTNHMILTWGKNLYIGYDEENEVSNAKWVYDEVTDLIWYKQYWKMGTQVAFCNEVISNI